MEEKKFSDQTEQAASEKSETVRNLPPMIPEEELKKLEHFTGSIEIPLSSASYAAATQDQKNDEDMPAEPQLNGLSAEDFKDFESLLWGGNMPDAPIINFGDDYVVTQGETLSSGEKQVGIDEIIAAVRSVEDPELMLNVYDLGLIYRLDQLENGDVEIDMTVTAPSCPVAGLMPKQVAEAVSKLDGVGKVTVKLVWEPAWTIDKMTDEAKYALNLF